MRWARSYSIIDHKILHGGYLRRLSHESIVLYLFLVVVGNRDGRSFYGDTTILDIVRLTQSELDLARKQLIREGLIDYQSPYWWVKNISSLSACNAKSGLHEIRNRRKGGKDYGRDKTKDTVSSGCNELKFLSNRRADRDFAKARIKDIQRMLQGG